MKNKKMLKPSALLLILLLFIIPISFSGCFSNMVETLKEAESISKEQQETTSETTTSAEIQDTAAPEVDEDQILDRFAGMIQQDSRPFELVAFLDENIAYVSGVTAAKMMEYLESHQRVYERRYLDILFEGDIQMKLMGIFSGDIDRADTGKATDPEIQELLAEIYGGGFRLLSLEGSYYPFIDYEFLKKYSPYLPGEYSDYLDVMAVQSNNLYSRDAGLTISWDELADRAVNSEFYLINHPENTIRKMNVANLYMGYLSSYLFGLSNTSNRDYMTNEVYDEVIESYRKTASQYPRTQAGQISADYLKLLEESSFIISEDMLDTIGDYLKRPVKAYGLDSPESLTRQVRNMYYTSELSSFGYILLVNGEYREQYEVETAAELVIVLPDEYISIGDIDGDGVNDAAVILVADPGGSGTFYYLHAVINGYNFIFDAAADILGDRVKINSLDIVDVKIYLDMVTHKADDPMCCPTEEVLRIYKYEDNQLFRLISHTGTVEEIGDSYINIVIEDDALLQIMLEDYGLPEYIKAEDAVYVEYYADYISEQNILQYIELLRTDE